MAMAIMQIYRNDDSGGSTEAESSTSADMSQPLEEVVGGNDDKLH